MSEEVMVVPRADLEPHIAGHDFDLITADTDRILGLIETRHRFLPRPVAEVAPEFKQIIPYVTLRHGGDVYLLRRTPKQTEARLHDKLSLGIGGHINPDTPTLLGGLKKELDEEVEIGAPYALQFVGILNDDTTDVGRVHLGAVYMLDLQTPRVTVRETEKMSGSWVALGDLAPRRDAMETWSQIVYERFLSRSVSTTGRSSI